MTIDIVGTLTQKDLALLALLWGNGVGLVCVLIKQLFNNKKKPQLIISDILISLIFGLTCITFSLLHTKGVMWLYVLLSIFVGF